jgi:hypothetical protein
MTYFYNIKHLQAMHPGIPKKTVASIVQKHGYKLGGKWVMDASDFARIARDEGALSRGFGEMGGASDRKRKASEFLCQDGGGSPRKSRKSHGANAAGGQS